MRIFVKETNGSDSSAFNLPLLVVHAVIPRFITLDGELSLQLDVFGIDATVSLDTQWILMNTQAFSSFAESSVFDYVSVFQFFAKGQVFQTETSACTIEDQNYYLVRLT